MLPSLFLQISMVLLACSVAPLSPPPGAVNAEPEVASGAGIATVAKAAAPAAKDAATPPASSSDFMFIEAPHLKVAAAHPPPPLGPFFSPTGQPCTPK